MTTNSALNSLVVISLLILSTFPTLLFGQRPATTERWLGINNMYYKDGGFNNMDTILVGINNDQEAILTNREVDQQYSLGLHYRLVKANAMYQQFEVINLDINRFEFLTALQIVGQQILQPVRGSDTKTTNIRIGYRLGKLFELTKGLTADASIGGYPTYNRVSFIPLTSAGFPQRDTRIGLGLDIRLGLNYQVLPNINIGYSFIPAAGQWFWHEEYIDNPILTERRKIERNLEMQTNAFEQVLDFRNISLRYVISADGKKRRKRRRRR